MKKVLGVIGGFFVSIWRWIKETAWVQPLLIVGIIFGVIFSIPTIVSAVEDLDAKNKSAHKFYSKYKVSLVGADESEADKLFKEIALNENGNSTSLKGQKFIIVFVQSDDKCTSCTEARDGFEYLINDSGLLKGSNKFEIKTIFVDEEFKTRDEEDWKNTGTPDDDHLDTAFGAFLERNYTSFEYFASAAQDTNYYLNGKISETQIDDLHSSSADKFQTPTMLQFDFTAGYNGITNVFVGLNATGSSKLDKASFLADAWNYTGDFGPK